MDGVLVDSEQFYYQRRKGFLENIQLSIDQIPIQQFIGADMKSLWEVILKKNKSNLDRKWLEEQYQLYKKEHPIEYGPLIDPMAKNVLQFLKRKHFKIGLASSSELSVINEVLEVSQLHKYFDSIVSGTQFKKSKPAPDIYIHAIKELGIEADECLAIEDSEHGIRSAKKAGLTVWALKDEKFSLDQSEATRCIRELSDICEMI